jgi:hypothetical protein
VSIFGSSASFSALSTIETMSGCLHIAPKPPPKSSYTLVCFFRCRQLSRGGRFSHQNHWNGLMAVHISCAPRSTCAQEMCVEVDAIAASTAATQKHNNQLVWRRALGEQCRSNRWGGRGKMRWFNWIELNWIEAPLSMSMGSGKSDDQYTTINHSLNRFDIGGIHGDTLTSIPKRNTTIN